MRLILLFLLLPLFLQAQQIQQLTKNNRHDDEVDIYKNRVVWHSGNISDPKNYYIEIFLAEGNRVHQITSSKLENYKPRVGSKFVVWSQSQPFTNTKYLMCYDGIKTICLDTVYGNFEYNTVTDYVLWNVHQADNTFKYYIYDGENILQFMDAEGKPAFGGRITEAGIFYTYWHLNINYLALFNNGRHEIIDSCQQCVISYRSNLNRNNGWSLFKDSKEAGKTLQYNLYDSSKNKYQTIFMVDGVKYLQKDFDDSLDRGFVLPIFTGKDFQAYVLPDVDGQYRKVKISVWRNGKYHFVSEYPFDKLEYHNELNDITFPFQYYDEKGQKIGIFSRNKIYTPDFGEFEGEAMGYANSVVWSSSADKYNYETAEVYYFCDEDNCITAKPTEDFALKIFHRDNAKQIAIEVQTPQAENFVVAVFDLLGREIVTAKFSGLYGKNIYTISSEFFTQGIYIVKLQNPSKPEQQLTQKLFISN